MESREPNEVPPVGEEIHLPGDTILPLVLAIGITLVLVGLTISLFLTAAGVLISAWAGLRWIREVRRDIDELPLDHH